MIARGDAGGSLRADLAALRGRRVFFGHHSVGRDVLDGLAAIAGESIADLSIESSGVGRNGRPLAKLDDFAARLERTPNDGLDLALVKLCYADFTPDTDALDLARAYCDAVRRVRAARPGLTLVHVTAPLVVRQTDWKSRARRLLRRTVWEDGANAARQAYNDRLRATFRGEPLFDLAALESTHPDGRPEHHDVGGRPVPMMVPRYSRDGEHLGDEGKRLAGRAFARALAGALRAR